MKGTVYLIGEQQRPRLKADEREKGRIHKQNWHVKDQDQPSDMRSDQAEVSDGRNWALQRVRAPKKSCIKQKTDNNYLVFESCRGKAIKMFQEKTAEQIHWG